jgi:hypothetical protein
MRTRTLLAAVMVLLMAAVIPSSAYASGRGHSGMAFHSGVRGEIHEGFHGHALRGDLSTRIFLEPAFDFGWGWDDPWFWGPYYYPGTNELEVRQVNYGTLEFKVKPENTKVYVDKKFIGEVGQLDHQKAYVAVGNHEVMLKAPDGQTMERNIYVAAGKNIKIDEKL